MKDLERVGVVWPNHLNLVSSDPIGRVRPIGAHRMTFRTSCMAHSTPLLHAQVKVQGIDDLL